MFIQFILQMFRGKLDLNSIPGQKISSKTDLFFVSNGDDSVIAFRLNKYLTAKELTCSSSPHHRSFVETTITDTHKRNYLTYFKVCVSH